MAFPAFAGLERLYPCRYENFDVAADARIKVVRGTGFRQSFHQSLLVEDQFVRAARVAQARSSPAAAPLSTPRIARLSASCPAASAVSRLAASSCALQ